MPTQRPMVAGYVDEAIKRRLTRLRDFSHLTESKMVEYLVVKGLPELEQAAKGASGMPLLIAVSSPPPKPHAR